MIIDRKEKSFWHKKKFERVDKILEEEFKDIKGMGVCHHVWQRKKQLLKEMYNIDWKSPAELNPGIIFD